jgi:hypothetical protein
MTNRSRRTAGDVLLELLGKVPDAATLEVLLEPEHLLRLLRARGASDETIRAQLRSGERLPGELLLDVLAREPDSRVLLAELGDPAPKARSAKAASADPFAGTSSATGAIVQVAVGIVLTALSGWYLFVRLDFLNAPGLIRFFPGAYVLVFAVLLTGIAVLMKGSLALLRDRR